MNKIKNIIFTVLILILMQSACKDSGKDKLVFPSSNLSYSQHINPLLLIKCTSSGCHSYEDQAANLDFQTPFINSDDYSITRNDWAGYPLIKPTIADESVLYLILADSTRDKIPGVNRMPKNREPLSNDEITAIWKWIIEGADIYN